MSHWRQEQRRFIPLLVCLPVLFGCADHAESMDITPTPDRNINLPEHVRSSISSMLLVLDSTSGLYSPGEEFVNGRLHVENTDSDPELELVTSVPLPMGRMPVIRLWRGGLPEVPYDVVLRGLDSAGRVVASGAVSGLQWTSGSDHINLPFNLRPDLLPPRVVSVSPAEGQTLPNCVLNLVRISFSSPLMPESIRPDVVRFDIDSMEVDASSLRAVAGGSVLEASISPAIRGPAPLRLRLRVSSELRDYSGRALDQIPSIAGAQGFTLDAEIPCGSSSAPSSPARFCEDDLACDPGEVCRAQRCVPSACGNCPALQVCDEVHRVCVSDCRSAPCAASDTCDLTTGVCS